jgi:carbon-monoxide dehydrogenase small subunit
MAATPRRRARPGRPRPARRRTSLSVAATERATIRVRVNGRDHRGQVEPRLLLTDFLRDHLRLTGTHVGCEHGVCGACTVHVDGQPVRACLLLAVQADGAEVTTVEGLAPGDGALHPLQEAFRAEHGLQCGFCTPGFLMTAVALLRDTPAPGEDEIRQALAGNLCRCTGYQNIVRAVQRAGQTLAAEGTRP